jgi:hypothetical protein
MVHHSKPPKLFSNENENENDACTLAIEIILETIRSVISTAASPETETKNN